MTESAPKRKSFRAAFCRLCPDRVERLGQRDTKRPSAPARLSAGRCSPIRLKALFSCALNQIQNVEKAGCNGPNPGRPKAISGHLSLSMIRKQKGLMRALLFPNRSVAMPFSPSSTSQTHMGGRGCSSVALQRLSLREGAGSQSTPTREPPSVAAHALPGTGLCLLDLPNHILLKVVCELRHQEASALACTCVQLRFVVEDAKLVHFSYRTPLAQAGPLRLQGAGLAAPRHAPLSLPRSTPIASPPDRLNRKPAPRALRFSNVSERPSEGSA